MLFFWFIIWLFSNSTSAQQNYDSSACMSTTFYPGTRYTCDTFSNSCQTFLVYRARPPYQTISQISNLLGIGVHDLLFLNNLTYPSQNLTFGTDVIVPVNCSCSGDFFQSNFTFTVPNGSTYSDIACDVFSSLVKSVTLINKNPYNEHSVPVGAKIIVPLTCACLDEFSAKNGFEYLVTYPLIEGDGTIKLSKKFGIPPEEIWAENNLNPRPTVYQNTTILVPLRNKPIIFDLEDSVSPDPGFLPTVETKKKTRLSSLLISVLVLGIVLVVVALLGSLFYIKSLRRSKSERFESLTPRSSPATCLSPDILSMCKYSLYTYSVEELKIATRDFDEESKIGRSLYKGRLDDIEVMIQHMRYEETRRIIDLYSKINHINIVQLLGVCYGEVDSLWSYLIFEFASNGCLRDCLSNSFCVLQWRQRARIAFDIATGLNYLHHCTSPSYIHMNINTKNVWITEDWRAKIANFGCTTFAGSVKRRGDTQGQWVAPEYLAHGFVSAKVDIFAFGVVLFELLSAQEAIDGKLFKESIKFLGGGGGETSYLEQFRRLVDPHLKDDYPLAEALCLAVLAKACVEDEPFHRPSMNDIVKILSRMV